VSGGYREVWAGQRKALLFGGERPSNQRVFISKGTEFLLQWPSPDWSRRKTSLCDLRAAAVKAVFEKGYLAE
jgi:hypothetical protein